MTLSRRTFVRGSIALPAALALANFPGARLIRAQGAAYDLVDLGDLGTLDFGSYKRSGRLAAINAEGAVAGFVFASDKSSPATWSTAGKLKRHKTGKYGGAANGINGDGLLVGIEYRDENLIAGVPVIWQGGDKLPLSLPADFGDDVIGSAADVNDSGVIVGGISQAGASTDERKVAAIRWTDGEPEVLAVPEGASETRASAITAAGLIAGTSGFRWSSQEGDVSRSGTQLIPTVWDGGKATLLDLPKSVADWFVGVRAIDDSGRILVFANYSNADDHQVRSYLYENGKPTRLAGLTKGAFFVSAYAINNAGQIVGTTASNQETYDLTATVWIEGKPSDLNELIPADSGLALHDAVDINDDGAIAAIGTTGGETHGVLLVPAT
jgi:uncharacterized membrane protein